MELAIPSHDDLNRNARSTISSQLYIKDLLDKQEFDVEYCSTEAMQADFLTKPLQGELHEKQMKWLMGIE